MFQGKDELDEVEVNKIKCRSAKHSELYSVLKLIFCNSRS